MAVSVDPGAHVDLEAAHLAEQLRLLGGDAHPVEDVADRGVHEDPVVARELPSVDRVRRAV